MSYLISIAHPFRGADLTTAETRAEANAIAMAEKARNPRVTVTIKRVTL